jgi:hypothetical protein
MSRYSPRYCYTIALQRAVSYRIAGNIIIHCNRVKYTRAATAERSLLARVSRAASIARNEKTLSEVQFSLPNAPDRPAGSQATSLDSENRKFRPFAPFSSLNHFLLDSSIALCDRRSASFARKERTSGDSCSRSERADAGVDAGEKRDSAD